MAEIPSRNIGLELVRITESAALAAARWTGLGKRDETHHSATQAMVRIFNELDVNGQIVIGEEGRLGEYSPLSTGKAVGTGVGPALDVVVDPIDGTKLVVKGHPGALSLVGIAPQGTMWRPPPEAIYMEKIVVDRRAAKALVPECMDAPAAWTLALIARVKEKYVRDLTVIILDRPRHRDLIEEIRSVGARILLRSEGDAQGAIEAAIEISSADVLMGVGGVSEGVIAACAVRALGGAMLGRLAPQNASERAVLRAAGFDSDTILTADQIVASEDIYFAATGITNSALLRAVDFRGQWVETSSLLLRAVTGTRRFINAEHKLTEDGRGE